MKTTITFIFCLMLIVNCKAQFTASDRTIAIPKGHPITIDGEMKSEEWSDAATKTIPLNEEVEITVYIKYDEDNIYLGFTGFSEKYNRWPEMLIDLKNDRSGLMNDDDWWFHISFQDCIQQGNFNTWDTCKPESDLFVANNAKDDKLVDFEAKIPFSTLNFIPTPGSTVGIAFNVTDTQKEWNFWPEHAQIALPRSWGEGVFE
ncbi:MAG: hypothetical protein ACNS60_07915 [Candidatus Cyclobacteriaceae bacterium M2_1C_046]